VHLLVDCFINFFCHPPQDTHAETSSITTTELPIATLHLDAVFCFATLPHHRLTIMSNSTPTPTSSGTALHFAANPTMSLHNFWKP